MTPPSDGLPDSIVVIVEPRNTARPLPATLAGFNEAPQWRTHEPRVKGSKSRLRLPTGSALDGKANVIARSNNVYGIADRRYVTNLSEARELARITDPYTRASLQLQAAFGLRGLVRISRRTASRSQSR